MEKLQINDLQSQDVISTLKNHVSIREYTNQPVDTQLIDNILQAAQRSPTSSNMQAYSIVVVQDQERKNRLAELGGNQRHIRECGVFMAICADISRLEASADLHKTTLAKNLENTIVATVDAALIGMSISTAAESYGLGTCMIGGMRNHPKEVAEFLDFPKGVYLVFGLTIGWPDKASIKPQKPRLPLDMVVHYEKYNHLSSVDSITNYDKILAKHYSEQGRSISDHAWTGIIANKFSNPRRPHLRQELLDLGFNLD